MSNEIQKLIVNDHSFKAVDLGVTLNSNNFSVTLVDDTTSTEGETFNDSRDVHVTATIDAKWLVRKACEQIRIDVKQWMRANRDSIEDYNVNGTLELPSGEIWKGHGYVDEKLTKLQGALEYFQGLEQDDATIAHIEQIQAQIAARI